MRDIAKKERLAGRKIWDRYITMYTEDGILPNGAKMFTWHEEKRHSEELNYKYSWEMRSYQLEAVWHVLENKCGLIEAWTGSGKSHMIMGIVNMFKRNTLIVCPTKKLVKEMVDKFKEFTNIEPGTYYSDKKDVKEITITTHMSFVKDMHEKKILPKFDLIIVDEADDKLSQKMIHALALSDCNVLVWLTGTPNRQELNLQDMTLVFGPHIQVGEYQILPDSITHYMYKWHPEEAQYIDYSNRHGQRESIMHNDIRFWVVTETIENITKASYVTIVLLDRKEEIEKYSERFPEAVVITWDTKVKDDEKHIERLKKEWGMILGSIKKMYRWVDIPECDHVIIASPIKFENNVIQSIGRALRPHPEKKRVDISIINDNVLKGQRYQQSSTCREQYDINPEVIYIEHKIE